MKLQISTRLAIFARAGTDRARRPPAFRRRHRREIRRLQSPPGQGHARHGPRRPGAFGARRRRRLSIRRQCAAHDAAGRGPTVRGIELRRARRRRLRRDARGRAPCARCSARSTISRGRRWARSPSPRCASWWTAARPAGGSKTRSHWRRQLRLDSQRLAESVRISAGLVRRSIKSALESLIKIKAPEAATFMTEAGVYLRCCPWLQN